MENRNNKNVLQNQIDSQAEAVDVAHKHDDLHKNPSSKSASGFKLPAPKSEKLRRTKTGVFIRNVKKTSLLLEPNETHLLTGQSGAISQGPPPTGLSPSQPAQKFDASRVRQRSHTRFASAHTGLTQFKSGSSNLSGSKSASGHRSSPSSVSREPYNAGLGTTQLSHQPSSDSSKITMAYMFFTSSLFYIVFLGILSVCACSLIAYLLLEEYYSHKDVLRKETTGAESGAIPAKNPPPNTIRFFNVSGMGRKFLFLVDTAFSDEIYYNAASSLIIKTQIKNSLSSLKPDDSFEILLFNTDITPICSPSATELAFHPANFEQLTNAIMKMNQIHLEGDSDVKNAISLALTMKPDVIFFVGQTVHLDQLTAITREELASNMEGVQFCAVEVAAGREPLTQTFLQLFARENHGQYQWVNIDEFQVSFSQESEGSVIATGSRPSEGEQLKFKRFLDRGTNDSLHRAIESDFDERFTVDISTEESRKHSPFGRELSTTVAVNPSVQPGNAPPKSIPLSNHLLRQIEADARIVYLSTFVSSPQNPRALRVGAESRLALWVRGAKAELPAADYLLGLCYKNGVRVQTNETKAFQCELRAAENGCLPAMFLVSDDYFNYGTDAVSFESAKFWLERGATLGEPFAQMTWANSFATNPQDRFLWVEKAALQGLPKAQFQLGQSFEKGIGTVQDHDQAAIWFEKAAQQGFVP